MSRWQDDPRFRCPHCRELIYLTGLEPDATSTTRREPPGTSCEVAAICIRCQHVYLIDEWRQRHVSHHPSIDTDS